MQELFFKLGETEAKPMSGAGVSAPDPSGTWGSQGSLARLLKREGIDMSELPNGSASSSSEHPAQLTRPSLVQRSQRFAHPPSMPSAAAPGPSRPRMRSRRVLRLKVHLAPGAVPVPLWVFFAMTLQMDDNRKYKPSDWLLIQKMEFEKDKFRETNLRMAMSYGNFSEQLKSQVPEVRPAMLPMGVRRLPENSELPNITKGWRSRAYEPIAPKRPEVRETGYLVAGRPLVDGYNDARGNSKQQMMKLDPEVQGRPAMELDMAKDVFPGKNALSPSAMRTPLLARTVVNAPARLDCSRHIPSIREANRFPKSASTASLAGSAVFGFRVDSSVFAPLVPTATPLQSLLGAFWRRSHTMRRSQGTSRAGLLLVLAMCIALLSCYSCFVPAPGRWGNAGLAAGVLLPSLAIAQEDQGAVAAGNTRDLVEQWRAFSANPDQFQPSALDPDAPDWQLGTLTGRADQEQVFLILGAVGLAASFTVAFILPDPKDEKVDIEAAKKRPRPEWVKQRDLKEAEEVRMRKEAIEQSRRGGVSGGMMPR
eukprot:s53_g20.t2